MIAAEEQATHNNDPSKDDEVVLEDVVFGDSQQQGDDGCEPFAVAEHLGKAETKSGEKAPSLTPLEQDQRRIQRCLFVAIALMVSVAIVAVLAIVLPAERDDGGDDPFEGYYCGHDSTGGLFAENSDNCDGYPLRSLKIEGVLVDSIVQVKMVQEFQTVDIPSHDGEDDDRPVVSSYQLPLDEKAAVTSFRAQVDDTVIVAIVKEKEQARQEFEEAIKQGKNAYLGEQVRPDIFHMSLGNLPSEKVVRIEVAYITPIETVGADLMKFILPTGISPRYNPWTNSQDPIPPGQSFINEGVQISLMILLGQPLETITSHTSDIDVSVLAPLIVVDVVDDDPLARDVVIDIQLASESRPQVYIEERNNETQAIMVSLVPTFSDDVMAAAQAQASEFIFVVDRSGSMGSGGKIDQLKKALVQILDLLPNSASFNIISFGSAYEALFQESKSIENNRQLAKNHVNSFEADLGGTEILYPLEFIFDQHEGLEQNRIVFVMTDGEVSNTDDVIEYVAFRKGDHTRVFGLGIGSHVSRNLVNGIARSGGGTADYVDGRDDEAISAAVTRQMETALSPRLEDVQVDFEFPNNVAASTVKISKAPYRPPPLLANHRFLMYYLVEGIVAPIRMNVTADVLGADDLSYSYSFEAKDVIQVPNTIESHPVHIMAARELIRDLEEARSWLHSDGEPDSETVRDEIVSLGLEYQVSSSETSFVAINEDDEPISSFEDGGEGTQEDGDAMYDSSSYSGGTGAPRTYASSYGDDDGDEESSSSRKPTPTHYSLCASLLLLLVSFLFM